VQRLPVWLDGDGKVAVGQGMEDLEEVAVPNDDVCQPATVDSAAPLDQGENRGIDEQLLVAVGFRRACSDEAGAFPKGRLLLPRTSATYRTCGERLKISSRRSGITDLRVVSAATQQLDGGPGVGV
jgi:hypothetical protein